MRQVNCTLLANGTPVPAFTTLNATLRDDSPNPTVYLGRVEENGRLIFRLPDDIPTGGHGATIHVEMEGYQPKDDRVILPTEGAIEGPLVALTPAGASALSIVGDHFAMNGSRWVWRGSTDFRLVEVVLRGLDPKGIIKDRQDTGARLLRLLSMKANNTGWELNPKAPGYWEATAQTLDLISEAGMWIEWTIFADTKRMMSDQGEQQAHYARCQEVASKYPNVLIELVNEDKHPTQEFDSKAFAKPARSLSSHGSGLSDVQPVQPLWHYATYHARRTPPPPGAKPFNNLNPYEFHPAWPHPVPYVCEESVKPEHYGYNLSYASQMGKAANLGPGATFHHNAWNDARPFTDGERACAIVFFKELGA